MNDLTTFPASIDAAKARNRNAGLHFFDPETLRFFGSRVSKIMRPGGFFVTSEFDGFDRTGRRFTVRRAMPNGHVNTVGEFLAFATREEAQREALRLSREFLAKTTPEGWTQSLALA